ISAWKETPRGVPLSPWEAGRSAEAVFVAKVLRVNGWVSRTVTLEVTETLKGPVQQGAVLNVEPGLIAGTESAGKRIAVYVPRAGNLSVSWRSSREFQDLVGAGRYGTAAFFSGGWIDEYDLPFGVELAESDASLDLRDLGGREPKPVPRRLIEHQRDVLTVQAMKAPLTAEQVRILEDWLKPEFRYEVPGPWLVRDLLRPIAQEDPQAARLLEKYEALPW
ncbi:MAG TPA: hypothetical protein PK082_11660, partial [Phycisphaerae bacterium]|nr:hypothetical protein [Phycisphaerae bacterium]